MTGTVHGQHANPLPDDLPPGLFAGQELLPDGRAVCRRLGLDPHLPARCNSMAVLAMSTRQTDRSLWFAKSVDGRRPASDCLKPLKFARDKADKGMGEYLCRVAERDVTIAPDKLATLAAEAARLNAVAPKTLAEQAKALELKREINCITGRLIEGCD